ncbi:MAG: hypothetical protein IKC61_06510 [Clostridia bacterium]|jgi:hypothetical protein|nr:hypothetical protein [Clostridia bacterium]
MASNNSLTSVFEGLPKIAKVLLIVFLGWIVGGIYRVVRYTETKNTTTLVVGLLGLIPPVDFVIWVADLVTEVLNDRITFFAD